MAHKVCVGQQFDNFSAFENATILYQNAEGIKFFIRSAQSLETALRFVQRWH